MRRAEVLLILTCEHGGHSVPRRFAPLFTGRARLLRSHRGWDPGALDLARFLSGRAQAPLLASTVTRLLIDLNRSIDSPDLFSTLTRGLALEERARIVREFYEPYRRDVWRAVSAASRANAALHISVHTFTPVLRGVRRTTDVGLLFDPARPLEEALCRAWKRELRMVRPRLQIDLNKPYKGTADGLTTHLRTRLPPTRYAGVELEVNQRFARAGGRAWEKLKHDLATSLSRALSGVAASGR